MRLRFDRGTVVLDAVPEGFDGCGLPGVAFDARVGCWRAPAYRLPALREALLDAGVGAMDGSSERGPLPGRWQRISLRPYQEAALTAWELAGRRGVVKLPTGAGKTRVALGAMARSGLRTLCLVPTRVLLDQWCRRISEVYAGRVGRYGDGERVHQPITVATYESAWRHMHRLGDRFDLLVVDEAHHFGRGARDEALEMCGAAYRLGLTATPATEPDAVGKTTDLLGPIVYELAIRDLTGGFLAPYDLVRLPLELTATERRVYESDDRTFRRAHDHFQKVAPGANWADFARTSNRSAVGREALAAWRRSRRLLSFTQAKSEALERLLARHRGARVLVFTADNATAYAVARRHLIMPFTCHVGRPERDDVLARFRRGELRALVSARVLNEGIDVPAAEVGIVVGGAGGGREFVQRVGRLLRPGPGKRATVYELVCRATAEQGASRRRRQALAA